MLDEIPQIRNLERISTLYKGYQNVKDMIGSGNDKKIVPVSELTGLDGLLKNYEVYVSLAKGLSDMRYEIRDFNNNHWRKENLLTLYVAGLNSLLESVDAGELNYELDIEIRRINNAIKNCYQEDDVSRLKFDSQNLLGGLKNVREMMFPMDALYPEVDNLAEETKGYVDSLLELRRFAEGKQIVGFEVIGSLPKVESFEDKFEYKTGSKRRNPEKYVGYPRSLCYG